MPVGSHSKKLDWCRVQAAARTFPHFGVREVAAPTQVVEGRCECGTALDTFGQNWAACAHSGRLKRRAVAPERTLARICREARATVRCNDRLRDTNVPFHHGAQLHFVDNLAATRAREAPPIRGALRIWLGFADGPAWWPCLAADPSPTPWCHPAVDLQGTDGRCRTCGLVPRTASPSDLVDVLELCDCVFSSGVCQNND